MCFFGPVQSPQVVEFLCFCLFCNLCVDCVCKNDGVTKVENKKVVFVTFSFHGYGFIPNFEMLSKFSKNKKTKKKTSLSLFFLRGEEKKS
jgi:hypothetical protein